MFDWAYSFTNKVVSESVASSRNAKEAARETKAILEQEKVPWYGILVTAGAKTLQTEGNIDTIVTIEGNHIIKVMIPLVSVSDYDEQLYDSGIKELED